MIDESATRKDVDADDAAFGVDDREGIGSTTHAASAARVVGALAMIADEAVELGIALEVGAGLDLAALIRLERLLLEDFARQAQAGAELCPIVRMRHVVEPDDRALLWAAPISP